MLEFGQMVLEFDEAPFALSCKSIAVSFLASVKLGQPPNCVSLARQDVLLEF